MQTGKSLPLDLHGHPIEALGPIGPPNNAVLTALSTEAAELTPGLYDITSSGALIVFGTSAVGAASATNYHYYVGGEVVRVHVREGFNWWRGITSSGSDTALAITRVE